MGSSSTQKVGQVEQLLKSEQQKTNQILQKQLDTVSQVLLKLANVERALGIDPTQEKLDQNYRDSPICSHDRLSIAWHW
jgi:hypothetical protein